MAAIASTLQADYGRGFSAKSLHRMVQFAEFFPEAEIVATLSRQLSWSHVVLLLPLKVPLTLPSTSPSYHREMCCAVDYTRRSSTCANDSRAHEIAADNAIA